jgi:hypothetical protein
VAAHPGLLYVVAGIPHPFYGQPNLDYYAGLKAKVQELSLGQHVTFVEKFLEDEQLVAYMQVGGKGQAGVACKLMWLGAVVGTV